jgi:hypothetical protein
MIRGKLITVVLSSVGFLLAGSQAIAQMYYAAPQYYQPMMMEYPMAYAVEAATDRPVATNPPAASHIRTALPASGFATASQDQFEELPHGPSYEISPSQLTAGQRRAVDAADEVIGTGKACGGLCGLTRARSAAFNHQLGGSHPGLNIPDCKDCAIHILDFPGIVAKADCCPDCTTGNCDDDLVRWPTKEAALADPHCDPECLVCVKEPFICQKTVMEEAEVVFFRCYERTVPFHETHCEDQRCIKEVGERTVKKLEPCTVTIKYPCKKTVIDYRSVWICIRCDCHH